jgi:hypothetical protein
MDFGSLWEDAKKAAEGGMNDILKTGVPALESGLEKWGANVLNEMGNKAQSEVDKNVKEILARPSDPNSIGSYIAGTLKSPIVQQYGGLMVAGVAAIAIITFLVMRK